MKTGTELKESTWPGLVPSFSPNTPFSTKGHGHDDNITATSGYDVAMEGSKGLIRPTARRQGVLGQVHRLRTSLLSTISHFAQIHPIKTGNAFLGRQNTSQVGEYDAVSFTKSFSTWKE